MKKKTFANQNCLHKIIEINSVCYCLTTPDKPPNYKQTSRWTYKYVITSVLWSINKLFCYPRQHVYWETPNFSKFPSKALLVLQILTWLANWHFQVIRFLLLASQAFRIYSFFLHCINRLFMFLSNIPLYNSTVKNFYVNLGIISLSKHKKNVLLHLIFMPF